MTPKLRQGSAFAPLARCSHRAVRALALGLVTVLAAVGSAAGCGRTGTWDDIGPEGPAGACGNGACDTGEDCSTCAPDCGLCAGCGDGSCAATESCSACPAHHSAACEDCVVNVLWPGGPARSAEARAEFERAAGLTANARERDLLLARAREGA